MFRDDNTMQTSVELTKMYKVFENLIQDRDFQKNSFLNKKADALAVITLAKTCNMYEDESRPEEERNPLAASVCYANIANLQLKNARYEIAYSNYTKAIELGEQQLRQYLDDINVLTQ